MNVRLVQLLASSIRVRSEYVLARLDFATAHPKRPAPPVLRRLPDASETTLREEWDDYERELARIREYVKLYESELRTTERHPSLGWLKRTLAELDQYARAMRWVLTVTESDSA